MCAKKLGPVGRGPERHQPKTTVFLAEGRCLVRQGVRALLEREEDFNLVGETGDGLEAVQLVAQVKPNVTVLGLMLPGQDGLEVARQLRLFSPDTRVVVLTVHAKESYVLQAFRNGALGYVLKDSSIDELVKAIREAAAGRCYVCSRLSHVSIQDYLQKARAGSLDFNENLTPREREIVRLVAEGSSSREIGGRLGLSCRTVETHRANAMHKLGLRKQTDLVRYAFTHGLLLSEVADARVTTTGTPNSGAPGNFEQSRV
jgi:DNA-binding NarL/FixJ family response regulator